MYLRAPREAWTMTGLGLPGGLHDRLDLLHVVDVQGGDAVAVLAAAWSSKGRRGMRGMRAPIVKSGCRFRNAEEVCPTGRTGARPLPPGIASQVLRSADERHARCPRGASLVLPDGGLCEAVPGGAGRAAAPGGAAGSGGAVGGARVVRAAVPSGSGGTTASGGVRSSGGVPSSGGAAAGGGHWWPSSRWQFPA